MPLPDAPGATPFRRRVAAAAAALWARAETFDQDGADPVELCRPLFEHDLFRAALPRELGSEGLDRAGGDLSSILMTIGAADLSAGRIYEGHVNAVKLVFAYSSPEQARRLAGAVEAGAVCGVWNAEAPPGLRLDDADAAGRRRLQGGKIYASGLGLVTRPLVTARGGEGMRMLLLDLPRDHPCDLSGWRVRGMRATATGAIDFTGEEVGADALVGPPDAYYRAPLFKGGAWRFAAVQTGAVLRLVQLLRQELVERGRDGDPHQRARLAEAAMAAETAELWCRRASALAEGEAGEVEPETVDAYVNLARLAVERAALDVLRLVERGLGLSAFTRPSAVDRVARDLSTYLRQPFPDGALQDAGAGVAERGLPWSAVGMAR